MIACNIGMLVINVGSTYQADHVLKDGSISESSLDHAYVSKSIHVSVSKLPNSSTDHLPVITNLKSNSRMDKSKFKMKVKKRSLKNFSDEAWNALTLTLLIYKSIRLRVLNKIHTYIHT